MSFLKERNKVIIDSLDDLMIYYPEILSGLCAKASFGN